MKRSRRRASTTFIHVDGAECYYTIWVVDYDNFMYGMHDITQYRIPN